MPAQPTADVPPEGGASTRHAYDELRGRILSGELPPGAAFSQVQLATQFGISRTPLREAVRLLQTEGLLDSEPNRRVRVSALTTDDFEDLYAMRIVLDSLAVRITVPRLSDAELAEVRTAHEAAAKAAGSGDVAGYQEPHKRFHFGLSAHAGVRLRHQVWDLWDHAHRYRLLYQERAGELAHVAQLAVRDHAVILEAAEDRAATECARHIGEHLARTALTTIVQIDHRYDPSRVRAALELVHAEDPTATAVR
jgi:DNA-binding GntR family transcriptional regulator